LRSRWGQDERGVVLRGDRRQQRVQAADPRIPVAGAQLGVAVDLDNRVVNIDEHEVRRPWASEQRRQGPQIGQETGRERVQLPYVPEGEGPQERTQRRGA
jgi:hypothetical protein